MSTPTTRSIGAAGGADRSPHEIADFVSAVRAQLDDLSVDEVTELTGGLEADLTDALAEAGSTPSQLHGDPAEYASELRAAAGLPPRDGRSRRVNGPGIAEELAASGRKMVQTATQNLDGQPWWPGVREFLIVIRPAWWIVRAWVVVQVFFAFFGVENSTVRGGFGGLVLLLVAIVLSVQLARGSLLPQNWHQLVVMVWNVLAILLILPMMFASSGGGEYENSSSPADGGSAGSGLYLGDEAVTNVFPYDAAGRPLVGVQLFDQNGRSLEIPEDNRTIYPDNENAYEQVPGSPPGSAPRWNAFPLQRRPVDAENNAVGPIEPAPLPLTGVPPLPTSLTPTPNASSTPTVTETVSPKPPSQSAKPKPTVTK